MAKGDSITLHVHGGDQVYPLELLATKAGRRLKLEKGAWVKVTEMTRTNKPTGSSLQVRADAVVSITTRLVEP